MNRHTHLHHATCSLLRVGLPILLASPLFAAAGNLNTEAGQSVLTLVPLKANTASIADSDDQKAERIDVGPMRDWKGTWTLNLDAALSLATFDDDATGSRSTSTTISGNIALGSFITPNLEARLGLRGSATSPANENGFTSGSVSYNVEAVWHFKPFETFDPFVGLRGGAVTTFQGQDRTTDPTGGLSP